MITVFTPTYNRGYILENLYHSLQKQSSKNFEWLIIDDGSTDNTEVIIKKFTSESPLFPIRYYKQQNGGKHRAHNTALDYAKGEIFFPVDSDDILTPDAISKIDKWFLSIKSNENIIGISANKGYMDGSPANDPFEGNFIDKTFLEISSYSENGKYVLRGERAICIYTDVFRKYKYPEYENERFMTEAVVYNRIGRDGYKIRHYNDIIYLYEYQNDGLTFSGNKLFLDNPQGYGLWLKEKEEFLNHSFRSKLRLFYTFTCELSDRYDRKLIAEAIGTSPCIIRICQFVHKIISKIRG